MAAVAAVPQDVPAEVLRYLASLDESSGQALLARARELVAAAPPPPPELLERRQREPRRGQDRFCDKGGRGCDDDACNRCGSLPTGALPSAPPSPAEPVSEEEAKTAAEDFTRALAAGDFQAAGVIRHKTDFSLLDETGWTCLHWLLHTAGSTLSSEKGGTEASVESVDDAGAGDSLMTADGGVGCECCVESPAAPASRVLLRTVLNDLTRRAGSVDTRNSDNATPLMFAADARDREACEWLLAAGADPAAKDDDGDTAAAWARAKGDQDLAAWLEGCPKSR